jgi:hypothetical protein
MKLINRIGLLALVITVTLTACRKEDLPAQPIDENYWLQQERGVVVYNDFNCDFYIVETWRGYTVMRSFGGFVPFIGDVLYGDFSRWGNRVFYNRSARNLMRADVRDYWLSWFRARDIVGFECGR